MAWYHRLYNVFRRDRLHRDIRRELNFHIAERVDDLRAAGMSQEDAARNARVQFGNLALQTERTHDMAITNWLETMLRNLRHATRTLARSPAFAATVILTLALGIGANSSVFSAIDAVLLRPLPFPDADRLVILKQRHPKVPIPFVAPVRLVEWNRLNTTLQALTGYYTEDVSETSGELPERLKRVWVAPRFLEVCGIVPQLGRDFSQFTKGAIAISALASAVISVIAAHLTGPVAVLAFPATHALMAAVVLVTGIGVNDAWLPIQQVRGIRDIAHDLAIVETKTA